MFNNKNKPSIELWSEFIASLIQEKTIERIGSKNNEYKFLLKCLNGCNSLTHESIMNLIKEEIVKNYEVALTEQLLYSKINKESKTSIEQFSNYISDLVSDRYLRVVDIVDGIIQYRID